MNDQESLRRRLEVLRLPVAPLRRLGTTHRPDPGRLARDPEAVGVGPDGLAYAVWPHRTEPAGRTVAWYRPGERHPAGSVEITTEIRPTFVQPLPGGRILLVAARTGRHDPDNAEVWSVDGELLRRAGVGDAAEDVLTTPDGLIWVSYFDEAMGGAGPEGHGLARFRDDLSVDWLYPHDAGVPSIFDCYALNVDRETAHFCAYTEFRICSVRGSRVTDLGRSPFEYAHFLLVAGPDAALIGRPGADYDVVSLLRLGRDQRITETGRCRLVLPDGLEARDLRMVGRGGQLHAFGRAQWLGIDLGDLIGVAGPPPP
ncbi:hypothetical protein [Actinoplanes sp. HUAS TT8]|uniref:hypothetical protein n=1 Tax=Actinoplanes sp. HUAS TT8 TaxID=3447453 RepID=UPI003F527487